MHQPIDPPPDVDGDPGAIYCGCCSAHLGRWRIGDVLICATCDTAPNDPTTKETP